MSQDLYAWLHCIVQADVSSAINWRIGFDFGNITPAKILETMTGVSIMEMPVQLQGTEKLSEWNCLNRTPVRYYSQLIGFHLVFSG